ncbi:MAG TPA: ISNCY family transposase [Gammaproteobacteria bacterium]|nr:ISNCY family transposase [Gammaproteobacteria bacterium]
MTYRIADIGMAAFSVFFMQSPSFLAHQQRLLEGHGRSNAETLFGLSRIPSDNHIRNMLDPAEPALLFPVFAAVRTAIEQSGALATFRRLGKHVLIALDGTEYFRSDTIHCPHCSTRRRSNGKTEYFHAMLGASLVAPGHSHVLPLEPEFIAPQDGAEKQDCESRAARRWLAAHGAQYATLKPIYLGDDLFSNQPICEAVRAVDGHFLFVCKPASHPLIQEYLTGVAVPTRTERVKRGRAWFTYRYRWMTGVPLRDGKDAMAVNWLEIEIRNPAGTVTYRNSFVTDLPVDEAIVAEMAACGRARWKIENETFNVLKTSGYHLGHNFGHGQNNLAALLATLNLLAFAFHTVCDLIAVAWQTARAKAGSRGQFFRNLAAITSFLVFPAWDDLILTLAFAQPPPRPP